MRKVGEVGMKEYIIKVDENKKDVTGGMPLMDKPKELVRCKDCKKRYTRFCPDVDSPTRADDWFCADAEERSKTE